MIKVRIDGNMSEAQELYNRIIHDKRNHLISTKGPLPSRMYFKGGCSVKQYIIECCIHERSN